MANPLASLSTALGKLFAGKKTESVLGVDIGSSAIKLVQLRKNRGVPVLETYGEIALGPYGSLEIGRATNFPAEKVAEALRDLMREANVTAKQAGFSIPFSASLISLIQMPQVPPLELARMIPLEARKYIPVPIGEVSLDWFVIPEQEAKYLSKDAVPETPGAKKSNVLLVAIHNDTLTKFRTIADSNNLETSFYEIEIFGAARAALEQGIAPVLVLDIGASASKLYIVEYGIVRVSHIINKGGQDITLALSRALNISVAKAEEMKRSMGLTGGAGSEGVSETSLLTLEHIFGESNRALLNGGGATMKGILDLAKKQFEAEVALGDPFSKVETPAFLAEVLRGAGPEFSVAVGVALRKLQEL